jgi:excisionase family DNA binding protein
MLLTAKQVSESLNMKLSTIYLWAAQGKIPCLRIYGTVRFEPAAIHDWLKQFAYTDATPPPTFAHSDSREVDQIVAAAKRAVYTAAHGETRPKSGLIRKEEKDGPV